MSPEQLLTRANAVRARYGWPLLTLADPRQTRAPGARMTFGTYIRTLRTTAHLSQRALAERLGVSFPYLCHVEHGERPPLVPARWPALIEIGADYDILLSLATAWRVASLEAQIAQLRAGVLPDSANSDTLTHG